MGAKYRAVTEEIILPNFLNPDQRNRAGSVPGLEMSGKS